MTSASGGPRIEASRGPQRPDLRHFSAWWERADPPKTPADTQGAGTTLVTTGGSSGPKLGQTIKGLLYVVLVLTLGLLLSMRGPQ